MDTAINLLQKKSTTSENIKQNIKQKILKLKQKKNKKRINCS